MPLLPRRQHASGLGPGHVPNSVLPPSAPPPGMQQHPFTPPPPFHPPYYAGSHPVPGGSNQYHTTGQGMNTLPNYAQPYGSTPTHPPFHYPHLAQAPYPGFSAQPLAWGYGHYPGGPLPNPGPHPAPIQPDNIEDAGAGATEIEGENEGTGTGAGVVANASLPKKSPNPEISPGGML
jgi:hypothetical protein